MNTETVEKPEIDLNDLTPEQLASLSNKIKEQNNSAKLKKKGNIDAFYDLRFEFIKNNIPSLVDVRSNILETIFTRVFSEHYILLKLKQEAYGVKEQDTHTYTLPDGSESITVGDNITISFDGTETAGIQKIKEYLTTLSGNEEKSLKLGKSLNLLLKPNGKTGMLNPNIVLQLNKLRDDYNSELFNDGIDIIDKAQIRTKTTQFISGWKFIEVEGRRKKLEFRFSI